VWVEEAVIEDDGVSVRESVIDDDGVSEVDASTVAEEVIEEVGV
jgi:hypothetical protein